MKQKCHFCDYPDVEIKSRVRSYAATHPTKPNVAYEVFYSYCSSCGGTGPDMTTMEKAEKRWDGKIRRMS